MTRRSFSRRTFLKRTAALGAAAALPAIIPSRVLATGDHPGANDIVNVGYIGVGRRGCQLFDLPKDARIAGAADLNIARAEAIGKRFTCPAWQDYRKLLESKEIDAVVVATPDHWHTLPAIHACQAGKDVYIEKPMTLTIREGRQLVDAARKYGSIVQTGSQQRSMAKNREACELIRNGRLGKLKMIVAWNYPSPWLCNLPGEPAPAELDWDAWCGQTPIRPYHNDLYTPRANPGWISFRPYSGGEITGWGAHGLDQIQWALGTDQSGPVEVWTEGPQFDPPVYDQPESRDRGEKQCSQPTVYYKYADGLVVKLGDGPAGGARFVGEAGTISLDRDTFKCDKPELVSQPLPADAVRLAVSNHHLGNWIECIELRDLPIADVEIGHRSATICHLCNIARELGRRLQWDPEKEQFVGDAEADSLVRREQRKGYEIPETV